METVKNFEPFIEKINLIENFNDSEVCIFNETKFITNGKIKKCHNEILLEYHDFKNNNITKIKYKDILYYVDTFFTKKTNSSVTNGSITISKTISIKVLKNIDLKNVNSKYICFIPTNISELKSFYCQFETIKYTHKKVTHSHNCLRVTINDYSFDIIQFTNNKQGFYIIESLQKIAYNDFCDYCFSIKQALGFITSYMPGGEEYIFTDNFNFLYCNNKRPPIESIYKPIDYNPYNIINNNNDLAQKYLNSLTKINLNVFSKLISEIHTNKALSASIIILLEASSIKSLLIIPCLFSVVVESLSKIISQNEKGKEYLIDNSQISKSLITKLKEVVDSYKNKIKDSSIITLKNRIEGINRPTNKERLTNDQKLIQPFKQLDIHLSEEDRNTIKHRNDFLHGNVLLKNCESNTNNNIDIKLEQISGRLYTLISSLILKHIGYSGYIINYGKCYESALHIKTDEEYYKRI